MLTPTLPIGGALTKLLVLAEKIQLGRKANGAAESLAQLTEALAKGEMTTAEFAIRVGDLPVARGTEAYQAFQELRALAQSAGSQTGFRGALAFGEDAQAALRFSTQPEASGLQLHFRNVGDKAHAPKMETATGYRFEPHGTTAEFVGDWGTAVRLQNPGWVAASTTNKSLRALFLWIKENPQSAVTINLSGLENLPASEAGRIFGRTLKEFKASNPDNTTRFTLVFPQDLTAVQEFTAAFRQAYGMAPKAAPGTTAPWLETLSEIRATE